MEKWNMVIDIAKCEDCNNCFLSCKDEFVDNDFLPYSAAQPRHGQRWINLFTKERGQCPTVDVACLPVPCMHCDDAACIKRAKGGAVSKTNDGIVIIDPIKARGQRELVEACPYGAMWWNEERQVAQKCTLCAHLLKEGWKEPRCVQSCPTGALRIVKAEDSQMSRIIEQEKLEVLHPEYKTRPRIYYKNLDRYLKAFIGGNVAFSKDGMVDCAEGAKVALFQGSKRIGERITDNYGDFKFDGLEENSGRYILEAVYKAGKAKAVEVALSTSVNVGTILLEADRSD